MTPARFLCACLLCLALAGCGVVVPSPRLPVGDRGLGVGGSGTVISTPGPYLVTRVIDGDTFIVQGPEGRDCVRLRRVNAPELDEPGGPEAREALEKRLLGKRIRLTIYARDRYGRAVAEITTF